MGRRDPCIRGGAVTPAPAPRAKVFFLIRLAMTAG